MIIDLTENEELFIQQYKEAAEWADPPEGDETVPSLSWERQVLIDCLYFHSRYGFYIEYEPHNVRLEDVAIDLYLSRSGHGTGFWDNYKERKYPEWLAEMMQKTAEHMGAHQIEYDIENEV